jgi:TonB family protein
MILALGLFLQDVSGPPPVAKSLAPISPQSWITNDDYPVSALRWEREGSVGFVLHVSANGNVTDCSVIKSSGWSDLDTTTCDLLRSRARFDPARDRRGRRIPAQYKSRISWTIPDSVKSRAASWATWVRMEIDAKGKKLSCTEAAFGPAPDMGSKCDEDSAQLGIDARRLVRPGENSVVLTLGVIHQVEGDPMPADFSEPKDRNELARSVFAFDINPEGGVSNCRRISGPSTPNSDEGNCPRFTAYLAGAGPAGVAAPYRVTVTLFMLTNGDRVELSDLQ